jgi:serine/threonine-protein kinase RsbW
MSEPAVQIETPAAGEYLAVVRAAATGLAAGLDFTYEQIDDLRIAVDEACAQLIAHRAGAATLRVAYSVETAALRVEVTVDGADDDGGGPPDLLSRDTFGWQILGAVVDEIDERIDAGEVLLAFRKRGGTR